MIPAEKCKKGFVYKIYSRNLSFGVYDGNLGFIGIRKKFNSEYLFREYHYESESFGTVRPEEEIGPLKDKAIILTEGFGGICWYCMMPTDFDKDREPRWKHTYGEGQCKDENVLSMHMLNRALFNALKEVENYDMD